ncbi:MAG: sugar phosphate isomerase/epimerase [Clostridia bacterium]|nr:sugar phosphate isomerase/epimerase [Clostridia bacterium]
MQIGISSSCLYPLQTEESLKTVGELGAKTAEIFFNSYSELKKPLLSEIKSIKDYYGINVRSIHPFTSAYEAVLFFGGYERRLTDGIEFYKSYFEAANELGAEMVVLHGGRVYLEMTPEKYAESYVPLHEAALREGIHIAHENIHNHHCGNPLFMKALADLIGDEFRMVLDVKQCRRCGESAYDFINLLGDRIYQVHISDGFPGRDCLAPGVGEYDFEKLFSALQGAGYDKTAIIELYRQNFGEVEELRTAKSYLENLL